MVILNTLLILPFPKKIQQFNTPVKFSIEKYPVYLGLPYIGLTSTKFEKQIKTAVKTCFAALKPHVASCLSTK